MSSFPCPNCGSYATLVRDSRPGALDNQSMIRRRRHCRACQTRFTTFETASELTDQKIAGMMADVGALGDELARVIKLTADLLASIQRIEKQTGEWTYGKQAERRRVTQ